MSEQMRKIEIIRTWMASRSIGALLLQTAGSFAWATCGASSYINTASSYGLASLLITRDRQYLLTTNIEAPRIEEEEKLASQGWESRIKAWYDGTAAVTDLTQGLLLASDSPYPGSIDVSVELARLRARLTPEEILRFKDLGRLCSQAMHAAALAVTPGQTEFEIGARLIAETETLGVQAIVNLIATDERIFLYRHPLPTSKKLDKYAMLVLCGRKNGLVCSLTRLVHFGPLSDELKRKAEACAKVDATFIRSTRPGETLGNIFEAAIASYAANGYAGEWKKHHQGGTAGYEPREYLAVPGSSDVVASGQVYAWNPSITGYKSEDTILVGVSQNEVLTAIPDWPVIRVGDTDRPGILVM